MSTPEEVALWFLISIPVMIYLYAEMGYRKAPYSWPYRGLILFRIRRQDLDIVRSRSMLDRTVKSEELRAEVGLDLYRNSDNLYLADIPLLLGKLEQFPENSDMKFVSILLLHPLAGRLQLSESKCQAEFSVYLSWSTVLAAALPIIGLAQGLGNVAQRWTVLATCCGLVVVMAGLYAMVARMVYDDILFGLTISKVE